MRGNRPGSRPDRNPMLTEEEYDAGKEGFEPLTKDNYPRCQAYAKRRIQRLKESPDYPFEDLSRWSEAQCPKKAQPNSSVCGYHGAGFLKRGKPGGRPPTTGRYSKAIKGLAMRKLYEDALDDSELLTLRGEMALLVARTSSILDTWADDPPDLEEMSDALEVMGQALATGNTDVAQSEYVRVVEIFKSGRGQWAVWGEIRSNIEQLRRLQVSEISRLEKLQMFLSIQQANAILFNIMEILKKADLPVETRRIIAMELRAMATSSGPVLPAKVEI